MLQCSDVEITLIKPIYQPEKTHGTFHCLLMSMLPCPQYVMSDTSYSVSQGSRFPAKIHLLLAGVESRLHF